MDYHQNARLTIHSREALARYVLDQGVTRKAAADAFRVTPKTAAKWVARFQNTGLDGLPDRSSRPRSSPRRLPESLAVHVVELRQNHMPGYEIARRTGISPASVSRILRRARSAAGATCFHPRLSCATNIHTPATCYTSTSRA